MNSVYLTLVKNYHINFPSHDKICIEVADSPKPKTDYRKECQCKGSYGYHTEFSGYSFCHIFESILLVCSTTYFHKHVHYQISSHICELWPGIGPSRPSILDRKKKKKCLQALLPWILPNTSIAYTNRLLKFELYRFQTPKPLSQMLFRAQHNIENSSNLSLYRDNITIIPSSLYY